MKRIALILMLASSWAAVPSSIRAQGTGRSMDIDLSASSSGMGGASNAVFWGAEPNGWGNPGLIGAQPGIRHEWRSSRLVPGLASHVLLQSRTLLLSAGGVGFALSGKPWGIGSRKLSYGLSEGVDEQGNPTGTFSSYETVDSWGFGVSFKRLLESLLIRSGNAPGNESRYGDLSFGMTFKDVVIVLAPAAQGGVARGSTRDWGLLARVTPTDFVAARQDFPIRLDLAYGRSVLNADEEQFVFINEDQASPATRHRREGFAARIALVPRGWESGSDRSMLAILRKGASPLIALGWASDEDHQSAGGRSSFFDTSGRGFEVTLARVFSYRWGHYEDRIGDIDGDTEGWSVGLPLGDLAGVRFDKATFPEARNSDLPDVTRRAFVAWIDPLAVWSAMRSERPMQEAARR